MSEGTPRRHPTLQRRQFLRLGAATAGAVALGWPWLDTVAASDDRRQHGPIGDDAAVPLAWFAQALRSVQSTPGFTPPVAARLFGYTGVALYEAVVGGMRRHRSLTGQLDGLTQVPRPRGGIGQLHWPLVANSALAGILRRMLPVDGPTAPAIDALEQQTADGLTRETPHGARRSRAHGDAVAAAIFDWSVDDGGHDGHLRNFPPDYVPPDFPGSWVPTPPGFQRALQPTWGTNRTMIPGLLAAATPAAPLPYSEDPASPFFMEAQEVYVTVNGATDEQLAIARFWSDDPGQTATPPGHSISILSQVLAANGASLAVAAEAYARLGIALSDAFVCCWNTKYRYHVIRPISYIRAHIDAGWGDPLPLNTPPFPEYTSGHSMQSAAAARVLTDLLGPMSFTDHTHDGRGLAPRSFASFDAAAEEAAISRLYGGIHYRCGIEAGLRQGAAVGDAVNALRMRRGR